MVYTVKNIKSFQGREGYGFECSFYKDGKRIGTVTDTADGGMIDFYLDKGEKEILDTHCLTLPKWGSEYGDKEYFTDADIFITGLVSDFEKQKQYRKWCKKDTVTVFRTNEDKKGSYRVKPVPYNELVKTCLEKKCKGKGLIIVNELIKR